jgi:hypothetical protein
MAKEKLRLDVYVCVYASCDIVEFDWWYVAAVALCIGSFGIRNALALTTSCDPSPRLEKESLNIVKDKKGHCISQRT